MDYNSLYIDENQCNEIAYNIYLDIPDYIKMHKDEFNNLLNKKEDYYGKSSEFAYKFSWKFIRNI